MMFHWKSGILCCSLILLNMELSCHKADIKNPQEVHRLAHIEPDYTGIIMPPNIAPLNFVIKEKALQYHVEIASREGESIQIYSTTPGIEIPLHSWQKLLAGNKGQEMRFTITIQDSLRQQWLRFDPIRNQIANEEIDTYLVYRLIPPLYILYKKIGIYQRNLNNFDEEQVITNVPLENGCINCHSFLHNNPDHWLVHLRVAPVTGMLLHFDNKTTLINTQTDFNKSPAVYPAWHPDGKYIAFSVNKIKQFFHMTGDNRDVYDIASDLILYNVDSNTVTSSPTIADPKFLETYPNWSADGRYLYFCRAPVFDTSTVFTADSYKNIHYDLMRINFDPEKGIFGKLDTVLLASKLGLSITLPRVSPDGRFLLFCMLEYGNFSIYRSSSDLYMMELETGHYTRLEINSNRSESYHCWSSNGHWIVFSSKRDDGIHARPYFSYVDDQGKVFKPFIMPQKDPSFYESLLYTYNIPELIIAPVSQQRQTLIKTAKQTKLLKQARYVASPVSN